MVKKLIIDGREVGFKATALTPRLYRFFLGRDMIRDLNHLKKKFEEVTQNTEDEQEIRNKQLDVLDLTIFENTAWAMAKQYDSSIPDTPDLWLDEFAMFDIYMILPELIDLWNINEAQTSTPKKK